MVILLTHQSIKLCRATHNKLIQSLNIEETKEDFCLFYYKHMQDELQYCGQRHQNCAWL